MNTTENVFYQPYRTSQMWLGNESLEGKRVVLYCEQGNGDVIQFFRYIPALKALGCHITVHCNKALHCILPYLGGVDTWLDKTSPNIPNYDFHVLLLDLPFLLLKNGNIEDWWQARYQDRWLMPEIMTRLPSCPYINFTEKADLETNDFTIGISWEGNPFHPGNDRRNCPVRYFQDLPGVLFCMQKDIYNGDLVEGWSGNLLGIPLNDYTDTMRLINALDVVVSVDTSVLHLSGALGKRTFGVLGHNHDARWGDSEKTCWYPSIKFFRRKEDWSEVFDLIKNEIRP